MKKNVFIVLILCVFCAACNNELPELQPNGLYDLNVIGQITTQKIIHKVFIQAPEFVSGEYKKNVYSKNVRDVEIKFKPVTEASVYITDGTNVFSMKPGKFEGYFETTDSVAGEVGKVYTLVVNYNSKTYTASDSLVKAEDFSYDDIRSFLYLHINRYDSPDRISFIYSKFSFGHKVNNIWLVSFTRPNENEPYVNERDLFPYLYDNTNCIYSLRGITPQALQVGAVFNTGLGVGKEYEMNIFKFSVSEKRNAYLQALFSETEWKFSNFSGIPGTIPSNFSQGAVGFFSASHIVRFDVSATELAKNLHSFER